MGFYFQTCLPFPPLSEKLNPHKRMIFFFPSLYFLYTLQSRFFIFLYCSVRANGRVNTWKLNSISLPVSNFSPFVKCVRQSDVHRPKNLFNVYSFPIKMYFHSFYSPLNRINKTTKFWDCKKEEKSNRGTVAENFLSIKIHPRGHTMNPRTVNQKPHLETIWRTRGNNFSNYHLCKTVYCMA